MIRIAGQKKRQKKQKKYLDLKKLAGKRNGVYIPERVKFRQRK